MKYIANFILILTIAHLTYLNAKNSQVKNRIQPRKHCNKYQDINADLTIFNSVRLNNRGGIEANTSGYPGITNKDYRIHGTSYEKEFSASNPGLSKLGNSIEKVLNRVYNVNDSKGGSFVPATRTVTGFVLGRLDSSKRYEKYKFTFNLPKSFFLPIGSNPTTTEVPLTTDTDSSQTTITLPWYNITPSSDTPASNSLPYSPSSQGNTRGDNLKLEHPYH